MPTAHLAAYLKCGWFAHATLTSSNTIFKFTDKPQKLWGNVSAGVNFVNFSEATPVFAKVGVIFGDDVSGVGDKAGMRIAW